MNKRFGALSSSVNPEELSLTVTASLRTILSLLVTMGYVSVVQQDTLLTQAPVFILAGYATWQALETIWGAIRKLLVAFASTD